MKHGLHVSIFYHLKKIVLPYLDICFRFFNFLVVFLVDTQRVIDTLCCFFIKIFFSNFLKVYKNHYEVFSLLIHLITFYARRFIIFLLTIIHFIILLCSSFNCFLVNNTSTLFTSVLKHSCIRFYKSTS